MEKKYFLLAVVTFLCIGFMQAQQIPRFIAGGNFSYAYEKQTFNGKSSTNRNTLGVGMNFEYIIKQKIVTGVSVSFYRDILSNLNQYIISPHAFYAIPLHERLFYNPGVGVHLGALTIGNSNAYTVWGFGIYLLNFEYMITRNIGVYLGNQILSYSTGKNLPATMQIGLFNNFYMGINYHF